MKYLSYFLIICAVFFPWSIVLASGGDWQLTFVGDVMLDREVRTALQRNGLQGLVRNIRSELSGDVVVANLEGPMTASRSVATNTKLIFTFDPKWAAQLRSVGFTTVSLANNHTLNFGQRGLSQTRDALKNAGLSFFGDPANRHGYGIVKNVNGTRIALIGYHGLVPGLDVILNDIRQAKEVADVIIVMAHEGTEYSLNFTPHQQQDYRAMIDAGATMVIGAHPHVVEPIEMYKGKLIAYSLGNFIFDQYFSANTQQGLLLHISGTGSKPRKVTLVPLQSKRSVLSPASISIRSAMLHRLAQTSRLSSTAKTQLLTGSIGL